LITLLSTLALLLTPATATAGINLSLSLKTSTQTSGTTRYGDSDGSASLAFDLGQHFRLGLSHRKKTDSKDGYEKTSEDGETATYTRIRSSTTVFSNSLDITLVLYNGQSFVPYVFAGGAWKKFVSSATVGSNTLSGSTPYIGPFPNMGFGAMFPLNMNFSLKFDYALTIGLGQELDGTSYQVWDPFTSIGINYKI
jgi:hypothetical protein